MKNKKVIEKFKPKSSLKVVPTVNNETANEDSANLWSSQVLSIPVDISSSTKINETINEQEDVLEEFSNLEITHSEDSSSKRSSRKVDPYSKIINNNSSSDDEYLWYLSRNGKGGYKVSWNSWLIIIIIIIRYGFSLRQASCFTRS